MRVILPLIAALMLGGCIGNKPKNPSATRPATDIDPKLATADYWLAQPPVVEVKGGDFRTLWDASEAAAKARLFSIDRRDYRSGLLVTAPMVSKQFFEFWRNDTGTAADVKEATLGSIRRTVYFQFTQEADGSYSVSPKVLVERESRPEAKYRTTPDAPASYWYALRRDEILERKLADDIKKGS